MQWRFQEIMARNVQEIDIWRTPIPEECTLISRFDTFDSPSFNLSMHAFTHRLACLGWPLLSNFVNN